MRSAGAMHLAANEHQRGGLVSTRLYCMKGFEILVNGRKRKFLPVTQKVFSNFLIRLMASATSSIGAPCL
jgi:hypothetical protein